MYKVLIVEDDSDINNLLRGIFERSDYEVVQAFSGTESMFYLSDELDLVILDLMLPGLTGEDVLKRIRTKSTVPVIIISGKTALEDKLNLLEIGADDYIIKPFEHAEVIARANAAIRRSKLTKGEVVSEEVLRHNNVSLYPDKYETYIGDEKLDLTQTEFLILMHMMKNPEKVHSRDELYTAIWSDSYFGGDNAITVHISNLRNKLRVKSGEDIITTVWGVGYRIK